MSRWTTKDIPDQTGRRVVITGATGGLGFDTARGLAGAGAEVILTGRNDAKGRDAAARIRNIVASAKIRFELLDLARLESVAEFSRRMLSEDRPIELLVNNAGVLALPRRQLTADGFEMQLGVNYLGHFALTAHLLPLLRRADHARVVNVASLAHRRGSIDLDDLFGASRYAPWRAYNQSKLAMLMFSLEFSRRSEAGGWGVLGLAAHPGWARTDIFANGLGARSLTRLAAELAVPFVGQSSAAGALPILYAATSADVRGGGYYGPDGFGEIKGFPGVARVAPQARDLGVARRLWEVSERLTGVTFGARGG